MSYSDLDCGATAGGDGGTIDCALVTRLADHLNREVGHDDVSTFSTWATLDLLYDFRDEVLEESATGKHVLTLYRRHSTRAMQLIEHDRHLVIEALRLCVLGTLFARRVLAARTGRRIRGNPDAPLDPTVAKRVFVLLARLRELAPDDELDEPIAFAESMLVRIRSLSPPQVWELLQQEPSEVVDAVRTR